MKIIVNGAERQFDSVDGAVACLYRCMAEDPLELWVSAAPEGPRMTLLKHAGNAFLTVQRDADDVGLTSSSPTPRGGMVHYVLGNGQEDAYPAAWCIPVDVCLTALEQFIRTGGARPESIAWVSAARPVP